MNIVYWSDYACPYCYIGETHMKRAMENLHMSAVMEMKAFELDPSAGKQAAEPTVDRFARKYGLSKEAAQARIDGISQMGRDCGLDFRYAETRYTNTFDAHRLTKLAVEMGGAALADCISERLYRAYFAEERELADHDVLRKIASDEGMGEVRDFLKSDRYADEVRLDEREAQRYGISAVPYFVVNGRYAVPGAMPVEELERVLKKAAEEETALPVQGMSCGPDGCRIADHT
ncbi:MAG: DsbA family oxidoreductase [Oscillibacter sp.]|nr:DsbA family oxidoreductase [Oscillibacter sp.]